MLSKILQPGIIGVQGQGAAGAGFPISLALNILDMQNPQRGPTGENFTRSGGTFKDSVYDAVAKTMSTLVRPATDNVARVDGGRTVKVLNSDPYNFSPASWLVFQGTKVGVTTVNGVPCHEVSFNAHALAALYQEAITTVGEEYRIRIFIRAKEAGCILRTAVGGVDFSSDIPIPQVWTDISPAVATTTNTANISIRNGTDALARSFYIAKFIIENVTGQANQNPSEYVDGTGAGPFVKVFDTTNGNTVAANVVTEAAGIPLHPYRTIRGVKMYDTPIRYVLGDTYAIDAVVENGGFWWSTDNGGADLVFFGDTVNWIKHGLYSGIKAKIEGAGVNSLPVGGYRSFVGWAAILTPTEAADQIGIDGVPNTALTITDNNAVSFEYWKHIQAIAADTNSHIIHAYFKKTTAAASFPGITSDITTGVTLRSGWTIDTDNGVLIARTDLLNTATAFSSIEAVTFAGVDYWHVVAGITNVGSGTKSRIFILPAVQTAASGAWTSTTTGSCVVDWIQIELNTAIASSSVVPGTNRTDEMGIYAFVDSVVNDTSANVMLDVVMGFASGDLPAASLYSLLTCNNNIANILYQDTTVGSRVRITDGSNFKAATMPAWSRGDCIRLNVAADAASNRLQISYRNMSNGDAWTHVAATAYDGAFTKTGLYQLLKALGLNNLGIRNNVIERKALTTAQLDSFYSTIPVP